MVRLVQQRSDLLLSKLMLHSLPMILAHKNPDMLEFFDYNMYVSQSMKSSFLIPWSLKKKDEFVFASNTTIITEQLIINAMNKKPKLFEIG